MSNNSNMIELERELMRAQLLLRAGLQAEAAKIITHTLTTGYSSLPLHNLAFELFLQQKNCDLAEVHLRQIEALDIERGSYWTQAIRLEIARENLSAASNFYREWRTFGTAPNAESEFLAGEIGLLHAQKAQWNEAIPFLEKAHISAPYDLRFALSLSDCYIAMGMRIEALKLLDQLTQALPADSDLAVGRVMLKIELKQTVGLFEALEELKMKFPNHPRILVAEAMYLETLGEIDQAYGLYEQAHLLAPERVDLACKLLLSQIAIRNFNKAKTLYDQLSSTVKAYREVRSIEARIAMELGQSDHALKLYQQILAEEPDNIQANVHLAILYSDHFFDLEKAFEYCQRVLMLRHGYWEATLHALFIAKKLCRFNWADDWESVIVATVESAPISLPPWLFLCLDSTAAQQKKVAEKHAEQWVRAPLPLPSLPFKKPIRVGFLSSDFCDHATAYLMAELVELFDRTHITPCAFSYGPVQVSAMKDRLKAGFDEFYELFGLSDTQAAEVVRDKRIEILVELKGYTNQSRPGIAAFRPAPIQVHYLGHPGTLGAPFIDYLIADPVIVPPSADQYYSEAIVRLSRCYQANDRQRTAAASLSHEDYGLDPNKITLCCFNQTYKITSSRLSLWGEVMAQFPQTQLWLLTGPGDANQRIVHFLSSYHIDASRIIFAPEMSVGHHLARYRLADLFVDTYPVTAHTTASDSLFMSCPLLTQKGISFVASVAASINHYSGMDELICENSETYRTKLIELVGDPAKLKRMRADLELRHDRLGPFQTDLLARDLEKAFLTMAERHQAGLLPAAIDL